MAWFRGRNRDTAKNDVAEKTRTRSRSAAPTADEYQRERYLTARRDSDELLRKMRVMRYVDDANEVSDRVAGFVSTYWDDFRKTNRPADALLDEWFRYLADWRTRIPDDPDYSRLEWERFEVTGESEHRDEIARMVALSVPKSVPLRALLVVDGNRVRVDLFRGSERATAGYLADEGNDVRAYISKQRGDGLAVVMNTEIHGGTADKPNYGIWLIGLRNDKPRRDWADFRESSNQ